RDVGAGKEGAAGANDHHRLDGDIVAHPPERLREPRAHFVLEGIDRWVVDGHDRNLAVALEIDAGVDAAHDTSRPSPLLGESSLTTVRNEGQNWVYRTCGRLDFKRVDRQVRLEQRG